MADSVATPEAGQPADPKITQTETSQPSLLDELTSTAPTPGKDSVVEKIQRAGARIFAKHGVQFKKGPGRPRRDGFPGAGDIPLTAPSTALPAAATLAAALPDTPGLDPVLVKRCCSAVIKSLTGFADKLLFNKAKRATDDAKFAQQLVADTTITQPEVEAFSELAEVCLRKYNLASEYAPEIGLAAIVASVGIRYSAALRALDVQIKEKEQNKTASPV